MNNVTSADNNSRTELQQHKLSTASHAFTNALVGSRSSVKTYVLTLSKRFMSTHSKAGQLTNFFDKIKAGEKIHTIRGNYPLWKERIENINNGKAILSIREWTGKPYASPQKELMQLTKVGLQKFIYKSNLYGHSVIDNNYYHPVILDKIAKNDGLELSDFKEWFSKVKIDEVSAIIHFTNFRY